MAQILKTQVRIESQSGIPADAIVNTFHWILEDETRPAAVTAAGLIVTKLEAFYGAFDQLMPLATLALGMQIKTYTLLDPQPRVPVLTSTGTFVPAVGGPLPKEVAVCLSYRGNLVSGSNPARRKGRLFLGPFLASQIDGTVVAGEVRPLASLTATLRAAGQVLAGVVAGEPSWAVYSPTGLTVTPVTFVSTDNAFDTQRRRGAAPTIRTEVPG